MYIVKKFYHFCGWESFWDWLPLAILSSIFLYRISKHTLVRMHTHTSFDSVKG